MAKRSKRKPMVVDRSTSAWIRRRGVVLGGIAGLVVVVVVVALIAVGLKPEEPQLGGEVMYRDIPGGFTEEGFPYLGSPEANIVLMEFTDFYCSHCRAYNLETADSILEDYVATGKVRYVLHYHSNGSPQSLQATEAAMCAADQGLYFQFQRAFFENPATTREGLIALARELGLDKDNFMACWDAGRYHNKLLAHMQAARAMGVSATPSFKVNDQLVVGNRPDVVRQTIEDELAGE